MIFERRPSGMVGFFSRGKHNTDVGSVNQEMRERMKVCIDKKAYIHQTRILENSPPLVEEVRVDHGRCIGF